MVEGILSSTNGVADGEGVGDAAGVSKIGTGVWVALDVCVVVGEGVCVAAGSGVAVWVGVAVSVGEGVGVTVGAISTPQI